MSKKTVQMVGDVGKALAGFKDAAEFLSQYGYKVDHVEFDVYMSNQNNAALSIHAVAVKK